MCVSIYVCINRLVPSQDSSPCGLTGSVTGLQLQLGRQRVQCSAYVKGKNTETQYNAGELTEKNTTGEHQFYAVQAKVMVVWISWFKTQHLSSNNKSSHKWHSQMVLVNFQSWKHKQYQNSSSSGKHRQTIVQPCICACIFQTGTSVALLAVSFMHDCSWRMVCFGFVLVCRLQYSDNTTLHDHEIKEQPQRRENIRVTTCDIFTLRNICFTAFHNSC